MAIAELVNIGRELLTEGKRSCILSVRATDLDDIVKLSALGIKSISQSFKLRQKTLIDFKDGSDVHDRRERIIGGLRSVHMIVGMDFLRAEGATKNLNSAVADDLIGVHVRLSARARLPDDKREVIIELSFGHFVSSLDNSVCEAFLKAIVEVDFSSALL